MINDGILQFITVSGYENVFLGKAITYRNETWIVTGWSKKLNAVFIARYVTALAANPKDCNLEWDE